ncbi:McrB family protein [Fibrella arboris]|uniref:McrB family protein n=1 Tax=Fibrella arboris TaxID=3242486 RepID=UPI003520E0F1
MSTKLPGFYIVRLIPRKRDGANLRGTFIPPTVDIREYNISESQSRYYDETVWAQSLPDEFVLDTGQPPRIPLEDLLENGRSAYELKPIIGDILVLVHGSRSPSGDGDKARRGLIGLAQVEDVHFYEHKQLDKIVNPSRVSHKTWTETRVSIRAKTLFVTKGFLITPDTLKQSVYYEKSGLKYQESMLGISSTSASGNISSLFSNNDEEENEEKVKNLLSLFKQFNPELKEKLSGTSIQQYVPDELIEPVQQYNFNIKTHQSLVLSTIPSQKIYFGAPGSGKSWKAKEDTAGMIVFRTTFHPDTDYGSFVGTYKPTLDPKGQIAYAFVPQIFTRAYVESWNQPNVPVCLIIDEINRGNCAQIFGDLFQLLDRDSTTGYSTYPLTADTDLYEHLAKKIINKEAYIAQTGGIDQLKLPPNMLLYATMNTSDQSLFPMDSAFKRRWEWEYVPINYTDAGNINIQIGDRKYNWGTFLETINPLIYKLKGSEDKQLGNRFVNPGNGIISESQFRSKVLFYLWNDVWRDEHESGNTIFHEMLESGDVMPINTYGALFQGTAEEQTARLQRFMAANGIAFTSDDNPV